MTLTKPTIRNTDAEYRQVHVWLKKNYGDAKGCENPNCEHFGTENFSHWANISGEYLQERGDFVQLCPRCHKLMDNKGMGFEELCKLSLSTVKIKRVFNLDDENTFSWLEIKSEPTKVILSLDKFKEPYIALDKLSKKHKTTNARTALHLLTQVLTSSEEVKPSPTN